MTVQAYEDAVRRLADRTPVGSRLTSAEWNAQVPVAMRERGFWSAQLAETRAAEEMRRKLLDAAALQRPGGTGMDRSRFVAEMRTMLGAEPGDSGRLDDITSFRRLELIHDWHMEDAHEYGQYRMALDPDLYAEFPAYEFIRLEDRIEQRDWWSRWQDAGAQVAWAGAVQHVMVALVDSPIWEALSRFGRPWPPYDFGSGMGRRKLSRQEAVDIGLIPPGSTPTPSESPDDFQERLEASLRDLEQPEIEALQSAFGERMTIDLDGTARWRMQPRVTPGEPLTVGETEALRDYTGSGYLRTNTALREWNRMDTYQLSKADAIQSGLLKQQPYVGTVHRGTDLPADVDARLVPGRIIQFHEHISGAADPNEAFSGTHQLTIHSRNGRSIQHLSSHPRETEVLHPAGSLFRVIDRNGNNITLEEI